MEEPALELTEDEDDDVVVQLRVRRSAHWITQAVCHPSCPGCHGSNDDDGVVIDLR